MAMIGRLATAWSTVVLFFLFGDSWLVHPSSALRAGLLFLWLLSVIVWCAFGVVEEADHFAELLGEPLGTLVLTLSIVVIEVALIGAVVVLGSDAAPTLGRDAMFAALMIVLNGVVGLTLLLGGLKHYEQAYNFEGALAYLAVIVPLSVIALVLPRFTGAVPAGSLTTTQAAFFSLFTILLYGTFLVIQTGRHRGFFTEPHLNGAPVAAAVANHERHDASARVIGWHAMLLLITMLPIVLLAKPLAMLIDYGIAVGAPPALCGLLIALIVLTPEAMTAMRAALDNQLQRSINLSLGASASTVGLTVPAILGVGLATDKVMVLGLDPAGMTLLALTLVLSTITFSGRRTTVLEGTVHLIVFLAYLASILTR